MGTDMGRGEGENGWDKNRMPIRFVSYNILNFQNGGLESALRGMYQANLDLGVLQETNIMDVVYTCGLYDYSPIATDVSNQHRGGVAVFYWASLRFAVEAIHQFDPNIVIFQMVMGEWRWYILRCYHAPNNDSTIESVVASLRECLMGYELLDAGDYCRYCTARSKK